MFSPDDLAAMMAASAQSPDAQRRQTEFRSRLVAGWGIREGSRILEIGCGQGDTTAVLANAVGTRGRVTAVDLARPSYGGPVTLGDSARRLSEGLLGERIEFRFEYDVLSSANAFAPEAFDAIVLSHCTWYFESLGVLRQTLETIRPWSPRLCLSEWDLQPRSIDQLGHLLAILIQGQVEAFRSASEANVRTPYSREALETLLEETGWTRISEAFVDTSELEDARWETSACLSNALRDAEEARMPAKLREFLASQVDVLRRQSETGTGQPLPSYSIVAERQ